MYSKIIVVLALVAAVSAQSHYGHQQHYQPQHYHHEEEHHGPVHYEYNYDVHDDHTGDVHGQKEARKDDSTQGEYYLIDADGHKRTVTYHVEGKSGFIAEVHREPIKGYQAPQPQHHQYQPHHGASVHQNNHY
ncbi:larval cuticle protein A2B-like isoform X3 [Anopheles arabiensis]|uniref:AGAP010104-PA n=1 Tax=Anopheles gambiae TaxID=7165 RepID=A0NG14_ANOGA|nr:larval cuticle protein A2B [Anopheles gambiae]XP_040170425.1 larval cuticle protein A2B-like isoform X3 [Anopheles arabiensis]XP_040232293.2 larval cuticle protein A2B-like isoform X1 [Anopheles coluzzii]EAU76104.1 AGAP010104-PA [Anopheles gambiae str. PEST]